MKFGLFHSVQWPPGSNQQDRYQQALTEAISAEELGFESVWMTEHHFSGHGITSDNIAILSYLAAKTEHIRLGTAVSVLPFHHPIRLAESIAVLDHLSQGRVDFGIGRGYQWTEYHGFNVPMDDGQAIHDEAIAFIEQAWAARQPFDFAGEHWQFPDVHVLPHPYQQPHPPIWLATGSPAGIARAVAHDWGVMLAQGQTMTQVAEHMRIYRAALEAVGRSFDPSRVVLARGLHVAATDAQAWDEIEAPYLEFQLAARRHAAPPELRDSIRTPFDTDSLRDSAVFGDPDGCSAMLERIREVGIEHVIFFVHVGGLPARTISESMRLFSREVMPRLAATAETV